MIFSEAYLNQLADSTGFPLDSLEKQMHLLHILREIRRHPYLQDQFALKGGTAINVYLQSLPRLSVDIDLNYIGAEAVETMRKERPRIEQALNRLLEAEGYTVKRIPEEHAGGKWRLSAPSAFGETFTLELDNNYLYRVPLGAVQYQTPATPDEEYAVPFPLVSTNELYAGKILALLDRGATRDLYDVYWAIKNEFLMPDSPLKPILLFLGLAQRSDWRAVSPDIIEGISRRQIEIELDPMLNREDTFPLEEAKSTVQPFLSKLLQYSSAEKTCITQFLDHGEFQPEMVVDDPVLLDQLRNHPVIQWKLLNIRKHLGLE